MERSYQEFIERKKREWGNKFDPSDLAADFIPYYENQKRIEVEFSYGKERGTVGVTTGWKPCFLLIHRRSDHGSSTTLSKNDKIVKVITK